MDLGGPTSLRHVMLLKNDKGSGVVEELMTIAQHP